MQPLDRLRWGFLFDFYYPINIDFAELSREPLPNVFIDMFGPALDWKWVLRVSRVDADLMEKYAEIIEDSYKSEAN